MLPIQSVIAASCFADGFVGDSSNSSSTSSSSSSDEEIKPKRRTLVRIKKFVEEVVQQYDEREFKEHFRLSRECTNELIEEYRKYLPSQPHGGYERLSPDKAVLLTIWYLANTETYRQISDRFDCTKSCAFNTVSFGVKFLLSLKDKYIVWPSMERRDVIAENFCQVEGLPHVMGAIDGSYIYINRPREQAAYINRHFSPAIILQAVCDYRKLFINVYCGEPGSLHDARVLLRSPLHETMRQPEQQSVHYLLGDSAYPNLSWIVTPFKDNGRLTVNQKEFNYRHSCTRVIIENAFALLKGRFRRLKHFDNIRLQFVSEATVAACVLHNICILNGDDATDELPDPADLTPEVDASQNDVQEQTARRDAIFNQLYK